MDIEELDDMQDVELAGPLGGGPPCIQDRVT